MTIPQFYAAFIKSIAQYDHDTVTITLDSLETRNPRFSWTLNDSLLNDQSINIVVDNIISECFLINELSVYSPITLWEGHKVVIRGVFIQQAIHKKRECALKLLTLDHFEMLSNKYKHTPTKILANQLQEARLDLNLCLTNMAEQKIRHTRHLFLSKR